jgi:hypothetical protein
MKRILTLFLSIILLSNIVYKKLYAQNNQYAHEWINFNQQYWKFFISTNGVYKITYDKLVELGLQNVRGDQFQIFNLGREQAIYVSTDGIFGASDYILFEGNARTNEYDKQMYVRPDLANEFIPVTYPENPYYLTYNNSSNHLRYTQIHNSIVGTPANASYITHQEVIKLTGNTTFNQGIRHSTSNAYYSSVYDINEGYIYLNTTNSRTITVQLGNVNTTNNRTSQIYFSLFNTSTTNSGSLKVYFNNNLIFDTTLNILSLCKKTINIPNSLLISGGNILKFESTNLSYSNNEISINVDKSLNLNGINGIFNNFSKFIFPKENNYFSFQTPQTGVGLNYIILDKTNKILYNTTPNSNRTLHAILFNSSNQDRETVVCKSDLVTNITNISPIQFNSSLLNLNKNYLILSDTFYLNSTPNYINQYVNYRNTTNGGNYYAGAIDQQSINELFGYGHIYHPMGIKNFIKYAIDNWNIKSEYLFIIGKGIAPHEYKSYLSSASNYNFVPVITWGHPGADNLLTSYHPSKTYPELATGRLSIRSNEDIGIYLNKVKGYEEALNANEEIASSIWKKNILHVAGGNDMTLQASLLNTLNNAKNIIEDTLYYGKVFTEYKRDTDPMSTITNKAIDSLINNGVKYITFYGHAAASGFDFNLNSPENHNSHPKYPIFGAYGCDVANIFILNNNLTISENYLLAPQGGAIAMIASNNTGWTNVIPNYMQNLYREFAYKNYNAKTLGQQYKQYIYFLNNNFNSEFYNIHTQSFLLQGDPGLLLKNPEKPDLAIEKQYISINPVALNSSLDSFSIKMKYFNIGKATTDSFYIKIKITNINNPNNPLEYSIKKSIKLIDSIQLNIPVASSIHGLNTLSIKLDDMDEIDEIFETNNAVELPINILEEDLVPLHPYEYAIVNQSNIELIASTLNNNASLNNYIIELDTTALFNSTVKQQYKTTSLGGILKWKPNITLNDSTVYYWRTAVDTLLDGAHRWNNSSFIVIRNGQLGWNQSHYYQFLNDKYSGIGIENNHYCPVKIKLLKKINGYFPLRK